LKLAQTGGALTGSQLSREQFLGLQQQRVEFGCGNPDRIAERRVSMGLSL